MGKCFPLHVIQTEVRAIPNSGAKHVESRDWSLDPLSDEVDQLLSEILTPYGRNSDFWLMQLSRSVASICRNPPWAIIMFPREYRLAGHFSSIRDDHETLVFSAYSSRKGELAEGKVPSLSFFLVENKAALQRASERSALLDDVWSALRHKPEIGNWLYFADPLPDTDVAYFETDDDELFWKYHSN